MRQTGRIKPGLFTISIPIDTTVQRCYDTLPRRFSTYVMNWLPAVVSRFPNQVRGTFQAIGKSCISIGMGHLC